MTPVSATYDSTHLHLRQPLRPVVHLLIAPQLRPRRNGPRKARLHVPRHLLPVLQPLFLPKHRIRPRFFSRDNPCLPDDPDLRVGRRIPSRDGDDRLGTDLGDLGRADVGRGDEERGDGGRGGEEKLAVDDVAVRGGGRGGERRERLSWEEKDRQGGALTSGSKGRKGQARRAWDGLFSLGYLAARS